MLKKIIAKGKQYQPLNRIVPQYPFITVASDKFHYFFHLQQIITPC